MQRKEFSEAQSPAMPANALKNLLAGLANDPMQKLRRRRARVAAQLATLIATFRLSHSKVAAKAGIKPSQLSRQLSGDANLTLDTISRICDAVDADFDIVFRKKGHAPAKQWWEHSASGLMNETAHFSSVDNASKMKALEQFVTGTRRRTNASLLFAVDLADIDGSSGRINSQQILKAANDDAELIAA